MMPARCTVCAEVLPADLGCRSTTVTLRGLIHSVVPYDGSRGRFCDICGTVDGGHHHSECPREVCPACGGYLVSCGCPNEGRINITIDEDAIAALDDAGASEMLDAAIAPLVERIVVMTGENVDQAQLRYNLAKGMAITFLRKLVEERAARGSPAPPHPAPPPGEPNR